MLGRALRGGDLALPGLGLGAAVLAAVAAPGPAPAPAVPAPPVGAALPARFLGHGGLGTLDRVGRIGLLVGVLARLLVLVRLQQVGGVEEAH